MVVGGVRGILRFENISITSLSEVSENVVDKLNKYLRYLLFISLPMAFFLFLFSQLIVDLLFHYGAFSTVDAKLTATALRFYSLSLPFMFIWPVLYRVFQIKEKLGYVSALALFGVILNGLLNYLFVIELKLNITGVCLGTLGAYAFLCLSAYVILWYNEKKEVKHA
jgi:putative peptidoglycan lipid II flippase